MSRTETQKSRPVRLPQLGMPHLGIANPCSQPWEAMPGTERVRHCGTCSQNVYNVSEMTVGQALALIREKEGRICVRMLLRRDGTVVTQDCRDRLRALRKRGWLGLALFVVLFIPVTLGAQLFGLWNARCLTGSGPSDDVNAAVSTGVSAKMGEMYTPPTPQVMMGSPVPPPAPTTSTTPQVRETRGKLQIVNGSID